MLCGPVLMVNSVVEKRRVAHVPNVSALLAKPKPGSGPTALGGGADATSAGTSGSGGNSETSVTPAQTTAKGTKRLAHVPTTLSVSRPKIPAELGNGKVPTAIRQKYLDAFCTEFLKLFPNDQATAYKKALEEEQEVYSRSTSRQIYANLSARSVKRLRDSAAAAASNRGTWAMWSRHQVLHDITNAFGSFGPVAVLPPPHFIASGDENRLIYYPQSPAGALISYNPYTGMPTAVIPNRTVSHNDILAGKGGSRGSWSIERTKKVDEVVASQNPDLYRRLLTFRLTDSELDENGFPRPDPQGRPGRAHLVHLSPHQRVTRADATSRLCVRCHKTYAVDSTGHQVLEDQCIHHWGRIFTRSRIRIHSCCLMEYPADGCSLAACHVNDVFDPDNLIGYQQTLDKPDPADGNHGVYALDCEMCYTTHGCELTRVTVVGPDSKTVYETMVKPPNPILDYNTRFSGITEKDLEGVTVTIRDVQAVLLSMFSSKTILIGHSLESDFKALKLIHGTVVDTSVVFPHRMGRPYKRALRYIVQDTLQKTIQDSDQGHDSAEDAISCMSLMLWRLRTGRPRTPPPTDSGR